MPLPNNDSEEGTKTVTFSDILSSDLDDRPPQTTNRLIITFM
jgi:hypothetical protein